jgi:PII-like signaling protein
VPRHAQPQTILTPCRIGSQGKNTVHTLDATSASGFPPIEDLPVIIQIVDKEDGIQEFLPELDLMVGDGLVTPEKVRVIAYRAKPLGGS